MSGIKSLESKNMNYKKISNAILGTLLLYWAFYILFPGFPRNPVTGLLNLAYLTVLILLLRETISKKER